MSRKKSEDAQLDPIGCVIVTILFVLCAVICAGGVKLIQWMFT